ncbi:hypothetical protein D3C75_1335460 [compost metagenome]
MVSLLKVWLLHLIITVKLPAVSMIVTAIKNIKETAAKAANTYTMLFPIVWRQTTIGVSPSGCITAAAIL